MLPSNQFGANAAWFRINVLLYNLLTLLKRMAQFERYADDAIVHCRNERQAKQVLGAIRFVQCGLELHPSKTRIVYCKDDDRRGNGERTPRSRGC